MERKLKIAVVAPVWIRVPPVSYGGTEIIVSLLTEGLVERGHDVTLFASGDSVTKAKLVSVYDHPQKDRIGHLIPDVLHTGAAYTYCREQEFDVIHDHTCFTGIVLGTFIERPVLATLHGEFGELTKPFYDYFKDACFYNAISESQRLSFPDLRYVKTVHNTIDLRKYTLETKKEDYALFLSRVSPQKAPHLAIEAAKKAGRRLIIAGKVDAGVDRDYFQHFVEPHVDGDQVRFVAEVSEEEKRELLQKAACLLFPIQWSEPFGLVMLEAMASGTPVIAIKNGSVPEVIRDGKTGFIVGSADEMAAAIDRLDEIDPRDCRAHVEDKFQPARMVDAYLKNYHYILSREGKVAPPLSLA